MPKAPRPLHHPMFTGPEVRAFGPGPAQSHGGQPRDGSNKGWRAISAVNAAVEMGAGDSVKRAPKP